MRWEDIKTELVIGIGAGLLSGVLTGAGSILVIQTKLDFMTRDIDRNRELIIRFLMRGDDYEQRQKFQGAIQERLSRHEVRPRGEVAPQA